MEGRLVAPVATHDSQAIALLCAPIAVGDAKPLTPSEWAKLAAAIDGSELARPGALVGLTSAELGEQLGLQGETPDRLATLLDRGGTLAFELERLESRGVWLVTRSDEWYPEALERRLGLKAPAVLFGAGRRDAVPTRGVAVVGSRDASTGALEWAFELGRSVAAEGATVVSGAARGVDRQAMNGVLEAGGTAAGVLADSLVRATQQPETRAALMNELLTLLTPYAPEARFSVGNAMGRNKLVYCLADAAVVVATAAGTGGTWAGATESLEARWVPLWVRATADAPAGNRELVALGAKPIEIPAAAIVLGDGAAFDLVSGSDEGRADGVAAALERFLALPRTEAEVCGHLDLERAPARALLRSGVESGRLLRAGKPYRYVAADAMAEPLFDAG